MNLIIYKKIEDYINQGNVNYFIFRNRWETSYALVQYIEYGKYLGILICNF